jgi:hypothetical protein
MFLPSRARGQEKSCLVRALSCAISLLIRSQSLAISLLVGAQPRAISLLVCAQPREISLLVRARSSALTPKLVLHPVTAEGEFFAYVLHILGRSGKGVEHILRGVSAKCPPRHSSRARRMLPARFPATWPLSRSLPAQQTQPPPTHTRCEPISRRRRRHGDGRRGGPWASWRVRHPKCCNGRQGKEMQGKSMYALRGVVSGGVRRGRIGLPLVSLVPLPFRGPKYSIQRDGIDSSPPSQRQCLC